MKFGIIGAMEEEIELIKEKIEQPHSYEVANSLFIEGVLEGKEIVLVQSGIGKVNAAMTTTILMERFGPDFIINTGSAGGFASHLAIGDVVIGEEVVHHDVDVTAFDYQYGQVPGMPAVFPGSQYLMDKAKTVLNDLHIAHDIGLIATGDTFMSDPERVNQIRKSFPEMLAAEMEAAAIAQVSHQYDVPFLVIRALSDIAGQDASVSFDSFLKQAAENAAAFIMQMVKQA